MAKKGKNKKQQSQQQQQQAPKVIEDELTSPPVPAVVPEETSSSLPRSEEPQPAAAAAAAAANEAITPPTVEDVAPASVITSEQQQAEPQESTAGKKAKKKQQQQQQQEQQEASETLLPVDESVEPVEPVVDVSPETVSPAVEDMSNINNSSSSNIDNNSSSNSSKPVETEFLSAETSSHPEPEDVPAEIEEPITTGKKGKRDKKKKKQSQQQVSSLDCSLGEEQISSVDAAAAAPPPAMALDALGPQDESPSAQSIMDKAQIGSSEPLDLAESQPVSQPLEEAPQPRSEDNGAIPATSAAAKKSKKGKKKKDSDSLSPSGEILESTTPTSPSEQPEVSPPSGSLELSHDSEIASSHPSSAAISDQQDDSLPAAASAAAAAVQAISPEPEISPTQDIVDSPSPSAKKSKKDKKKKKGQDQQSSRPPTDLDPDLAGATLDGAVEAAAPAQTETNGVGQAAASVAPAAPLQGSTGTNGCKPSGVDAQPINTPEQEEPLPPRQQHQPPPPPELVVTDHQPEPEPEHLCLAAAEVPLDSFSLTQRNTRISKKAAKLVGTTTSVSVAGSTAPVDSDSPTRSSTTRTPDTQSKADDIVQSLSLPSASAPATGPARVDIATVASPLQQDSRCSLDHQQQPRQRPEKNSSQAVSTTPDERPSSVSSRRGQLQGDGGKSSSTTTTKPSKSRSSRATNTSTKEKKRTSQSAMSDPSPSPYSLLNKKSSTSSLKKSSSTRSLKAKKSGTKTPKSSSADDWPLGSPELAPVKDEAVAAVPVPVLTKAKPPPTAITAKEIERALKQLSTVAEDEDEPADEEDPILKLAQAQLAKKLGSSTASKNRGTGHKALETISEGLVSSNGGSKSLKRHGLERTKEDRRIGNGVSSSSKIPAAAAVGERHAPAAAAGASQSESDDLERHPHSLKRGKRKMKKMVKQKPAAAAASPSSVAVVASAASASAAASARGKKKSAKPKKKVAAAGGSKASAAAAEPWPTFFEVYADQEEDDEEEDFFTAAGTVNGDEVDDVVHVHVSVFGDDDAHVANDVDVHVAVAVENKEGKVIDETFADKLGPDQPQPDLLDTTQQTPEPEPKPELERSVVAEEPPKEVEVDNVEATVVPESTPAPAVEEQAVVEPTTQEVESVPEPEPAVEEQAAPTTSSKKDKKKDKKKKRGSVAALPEEISSPAPEAEESAPVVEEPLPVAESSPSADADKSLASEETVVEPIAVQPEATVEPTAKTPADLAEAEPTATKKSKKDKKDKKKKRASVVESPEELAPAPAEEPSPIEESEQPLEASPVVDEGLVAEPEPTPVTVAAEPEPTPEPETIAEPSVPATEEEPSSSGAKKTKKDKKKKKRGSVVDETVFAPAPEEEAGPAPVAEAELPVETPAEKLLDSLPEVSEPVVEVPPETAIEIPEAAPAPEQLAEPSAVIPESSPVQETEPAVETEAQKPVQEEAPAPTSKKAKKKKGKIAAAIAAFEAMGSPSQSESEVVPSPSFAKKLKLREAASAPSPTPAVDAATKEETPLATTEEEPVPAVTSEPAPAPPAVEEEAGLVASGKKSKKQKNNKKKGSVSDSDFVLSPSAAATATVAENQDQDQDRAMAVPEEDPTTTESGPTATEEATATADVIAPGEDAAIASAALEAIQEQTDLMNDMNMIVATGKEEPSPPDQEEDDESSLSMPAKKLSKEKKRQGSSGALSSSSPDPVLPEESSLILPSSEPIDSSAAAVGEVVEEQDGDDELASVSKAKKGKKGNKAKKGKKESSPVADDEEPHPASSSVDVVPDQGEEYSRHVVAEVVESESLSHSYTGEDGVAVVKEASTLAVTEDVAVEAEAPIVESASAGLVSPIEEEVPVLAQVEEAVPTTSGGKKSKKDKKEKRASKVLDLESAAADDVDTTTPAPAPVVEEEIVPPAANTVTEHKTETETEPKTETDIVAEPEATVGETAVEREIIPAAESETLPSEETAVVLGNESVPIAAAEVQETLQPEEETTAAAASGKKAKKKKKKGSKAVVDSEITSSGVATPVEQELGTVVVAEPESIAAVEDVPAFRPVEEVTAAPAAIEEPLVEDPTSPASASVLVEEEATLAPVSAPEIQAEAEIKVRPETKEEAAALVPEEEASVQPEEEPATTSKKSKKKKKKGSKMVDNEVTSSGVATPVEQEVMPTASEVTAEPEAISVAEETVAPTPAPVDEPAVGEDATLPPAPAPTVEAEDVAAPQETQLEPEPEEAEPEATTAGKKSKKKKKKGSKVVDSEPPVSSGVATPAEQDPVPAPAEPEPVLEETAVLAEEPAPIEEAIPVSVEDAVVPTPGVEAEAEKVETTPTAGDVLPTPAPAIAEEVHPQLAQTEAEIEPVEETSSSKKSKKKKKKGSKAAALDVEPTSSGVATPVEEVMPPVLVSEPAETTETAGAEPEPSVEEAPVSESIPAEETPAVDAPVLGEDIVTPPQAEKMVESEPALEPQPEVQSETAEPAAPTKKSKKDKKKKKGSKVVDDSDAVASGAATPLVEEPAEVVTPAPEVAPVATELEAAAEEATPAIAKEVVTSPVEDRSSDIAPESSTPAPDAEAQPEEEAVATPTKKSKKDKKKKRASKVVDDSDVVASGVSRPIVEEPAETIPLSPTAEIVEPIAADAAPAQEEEPTPAAVEEVVTSSAEDKTLDMAAEEAPAEPEVQVEEATATPTKKSKKDKEKKRASSKAVDDSELVSSGVATPVVEEAPVLSEEVVAEPETIVEETPTVSVSEPAPAEEAPSPKEDKPEAEVEVEVQVQSEEPAEEPVAAPTKKSKKDKKKKKGSKAVDVDESEVVAESGVSTPAVGEASAPATLAEESVVAEPEAIISEEALALASEAAEPKHIFADEAPVPISESVETVVLVEEVIASSADDSQKPEVEAQPEEILESAPVAAAKKSKKDKKKKKGSKGVDDFEAVSSGVATPVGEPSETAMAEPEPIVEEVSAPAPISEAPGITEEIPVPEEVVVQPKEVVPPAEEDTVPAKKSKKDKKKKKGSKVIDDFEAVSSGVETPVGEPSETAMAEPESIVEEGPAPATEEPAVEPMPEEATHPVEEDIATPAKKSKKDKKKKKGSKAAEPEEASASDAVATPILEEPAAPTPATEEPFSEEQEPSAEDKVPVVSEEPATVGAEIPEIADKPVQEEPLATPVEEQAAEEAPVSSKKSKKDKKKKKGSKVLAADDLDAPSSSGVATPVVVEEQQPEPEVEASVPAQVLDEAQTVEEPVSLPVDEPSKDDVPVQTEQSQEVPVVEVEKQQVEEAVPEPPAAEEEPIDATPSSKKSKKKKKKGSKVVDSEPASGTITPVVAEPAEPVAEPAAEPVVKPIETAEAPVKVPTTTETETPIAPVSEAQPVPEATTLSPEQETKELELVDVPATSPQQEQQRDSAETFDAPAKKSKKEKKKKKGSKAHADSEPASGTLTPSVEEAPILDVAQPVEVAPQSEELPITEQDSSPVAESKDLATEEPASEAVFDVTLEDAAISPPSETPFLEDAAPVAEVIQEPTPAEAEPASEASQVQAEEETPVAATSSGKKSKKDKKKKKGKLAADSEPASGVQTPVIKAQNPLAAEPAEAVPEAQVETKAAVEEIDTVAVPPITLGEEAPTVDIADVVPAGEVVSEVQLDDTLLAEVKAEIAAEVEAEDIASGFAPEPETAEVKPAEEAQPEDEWAATTPTTGKKSKKDKKKKKGKQVDAESPVAESPIAEEPFTSLVAEQAEIAAPDAPAEEAIPEAPIDAPLEETLVPEEPTPPTQAREEDVQPEDEWAATPSTGKKGKKDKKKKKGKSIESPIESELQTPVVEEPSAMVVPDEATAMLVPEEAPVEEAIPAETVAEEPATAPKPEQSVVDVTPEETQPEVQADEEWAATPTKKGKKDKKKKGKGKQIESASSIEAESPAAAEPSPPSFIPAESEDEAQIEAPVPEPSAERSIEADTEPAPAPAIEPAEPSAQVSVEPTSEPAEQVKQDTPPVEETPLSAEGVQQPQEEEWPATTIAPAKKSKKDKKKKGKGKQLDSEEAASGAQTPVFVEEESSSAERGLDLAAGLAAGAAAGSIAAALLSSHDDKSISVSEPEPAGQPIEEVREVAAPAEQDDEWAVPGASSGKSKKDKKSKKKGKQLQVEEPVEPVFPVEESTEQTPIVAEGISEPLPDAPLETEPAAVVEPVPEAEPVAETISEPVQEEDTQPQPEEPEWAVPVSGKKAKKDKKKKKGSKVLDLDSEPASGVQTPVVLEEPLISEEPAPIPEPAPVVEESTPMVDEPVSVEAEPAVEKSLPGPETAAEVQEEAITEQPAEETEWAVPSATTKKSKKDRKKKKGSKVLDLDSEPASGVQTPAVVEEETAIPEAVVPEFATTTATDRGLDIPVDNAASTADAEPAPETTIEPKVQVQDAVPAAESLKPLVDVMDFIVAESEPVVETPKPAVDVTDFMVAEPEVLPEPSTEVQDWATAEQEVVPEQLPTEDTEWPMNQQPAKKSKKDKKKKRGSKVVDSEPASGAMTPVVPVEDAAVSFAAAEPEVLERAIYAEVAPVVDEPAPAEAEISIPAVEDDTGSREVTMEDVVGTTAEPALEEVATELPKEPEAEPEPEPAADEWAPLPSKKSKKGKKDAASSLEIADSGASTPVVEEPVPEVAPAAEPVVVASEEVQPVAVEEVAETFKDITPGEPEAPKAEDEFPEFVATTKKGKKDKKKKGKKVDTFVEEEPSASLAVEEPTTSTDLAEPTISEQVEASKDLAAEPSPIEEPSASREINTAEDEWSATPAPAKKSKKDKKKKKRNTFTLEDAPTPIEEEPVPSAAEDKDKDVAVEEPAKAQDEQPEITETAQPRMDKTAEALAGVEDLTKPTVEDVNPDVVPRDNEKKQHEDAHDYFASKTAPDDKPQDTVEIHPAVSDAILNRSKSPISGSEALLAGAAAAAATTIGLGLIDNPPPLYPEDAPSPKLLSAMASPVDESISRSIETAVAAEHLKHDIEHDDDILPLKKTKTMEMEEGIASAREIAAEFLEKPAAAGHDYQAKKEPLFDEPMHMPEPETETDKKAEEPTEEEPITRGRRASRRESKDLAASYLEATSHPHGHAHAANEETAAPVSVPVHTATTPTPIISKRQSRELAAEFMSSITYENIIREKKSIPSDLEKARMTPQRSVREMAAAFLERERVASPSPSSSKERAAVVARKERTFSPMRTGGESPMREEFERTATPLRRERSFNVEGDENKEKERSVTPLRKERSFKVEDDKQTEKEKAEIAAAGAALTGGVALLAKKFGGAGTASTPTPATPSMVESRKKIFEKTDVVAEKSEKGKEKEVVDVDRGMPMDVDPVVSVADVHPSATRDMDIDDKPPAMDTFTRDIGLGLSTPKIPVGLGRQDSETIPRSIKEGAPLDKDKSKKRDRREKREASPEPVQRAFSFPDDIADEEAFTTAPVPTTTRELKTPTRSLDDEPVRGIPRVASITDFMRSVTNLPPVQEELSDEEPVKKETPRHSGSSSHGHKNALLGAAAAAALASATTAKRDSHSPSSHGDRGDRDSGFGSDSPHVSRQLFLKPHDDESHRDSGVHLRDSRDYQHDSDTHLKATPSAAVKKSSPLAGSSITGKFPSTSTDTPRTPRTPEPEKLVVKKRTISSKPDTLTAASSSSVSATRSVSDSHAPSQSQRAYSSARSTDPTPPRRVASNTSISRLRTPEPLGLRPDSPGAASLRSYTGTPPLRRVDKRVSGDLRSVSRSQQDLSASAAKEKAVAGAALVGAGAIAAVGAAALLSGSGAASSSTPASAADRNSTTTPVANEGRVRAKDMTDVYDGYGEGRIGSPRSPTRPHSMRRRQSMQVLELESRLAQLTEENRQLAEARAHAEASTSQRNSSVLADRDTEIESLKRMLQEANEVIERLKQTNEGLRSSTSAIAVKHHEEVRRLEALNAAASRELESARSTHNNLHARTIQEKDSEIAQLRAQLEASTAQIRELQRQILETSRPTPSTESDFLANHDVDYFDHRCQQLCAHVQQWVLRFSKFSDMRACRLTSEINDEKLIDRLDNAVLDGSDVDNYLADRVKRRDIFMSMTMTMVWEFVFVRYLFGMDREQRQKLKTLEKQLSEVGPTHAVRQWRAITLTLLARRPTFKKQRDQDTEAVVQTLLAALSKILPPPSNLESQIQSQLRKVIREAVDLAIEMRCQRAEYAMLPPLQPEYDDNGELTETVAFNAALMNDRSVSNSSHDDTDAQARNEELEAAGATVRVVLFPLVVRKGDDTGRGEDEVVVCPAQVLVNSSHHMRGGSTAGSTVMDKGKGIRMVTPSSDAGGVSLLARSTGTAPTEGGRDPYGRSPARERERERGGRGVTPASDLARDDEEEEEEEDEDTDMDDGDGDGHDVQGARAKTAAYLEGRA